MHPSSASPSTTTSRRDARFTSSGAPATSASRSFARTSRTWRRSSRPRGGHDVVVHLASNPDIARAATEPSIDFDEGTLLTHHVLEAMRSRSTSGAPLRVGQRRVRRPRRDRGRRGPGAARPDLDLRREQARGRGADLRLQLHVRPVGTCSGSETWSGRCRPTASASTSCVRSCSDPTRPLRSSATERRASRTSTSTTSSTPCSSRTQGRALRRVQRRDGRLRHGRGDRRSRRRVRRPRAEGVRYEYTGGDRGWKGDVPVVRLSIERIRGLGWAPSRTSRRRCASR